MPNQIEKTSDCLNCGHHFTDPDRYCPECGQKNGNLNIPFKHLIQEFLEGILHIDVKLIKTAKYLLIKPGFLTQEFNQGRRVKYVQPVRIYVFISFVFFFLLNFVTITHEEDGEPGEGGKAQNKVHLGISLEKVKSDDFLGLTKKQSDSLINERYMGSSNFSKLLAYQLAKVVRGGKNEYIHSLIKYFSYSMFLLMPLLALFIYLFNKRSFYVSSLIFSIHFHSFIFVLLIFYLLLNMIFTSIFMLLIIFITGFIYLYKSMIFVFPQNRIKGIFKSIGITFIYNAFLLGALFWVVVLALIAI